MSKRASRAWLFELILTCLLLDCSLPGTNCQEGTVESWDKFSRLLPSNSVYKQRDRNAAATADNPATLLRSLSDNNVMDASKAHAGSVKHETAEGEEEEIYEDDYEAEVDPRTAPDGSKFSRLVDERTEKPGSGAARLSADAEDASRAEDYLEDPSTSQSDATFYYGDYESSNRSQYEAIAGADALDYPDPGEEAEEEEGGVEEEDEEYVENVSHGGTAGPHHSPSETPNRNPSPTEKSPKTDNSSADTSDLLEEKQLDSPKMNFEEGSSMEGSEQAFTILEPPSKHRPSFPDDSSILIGEAVVSVVTTKSVVNGTISVPTTPSPTTTEHVMEPPSFSMPTVTTERSLPVVTTEDTSRILASVQTSRSISGARFLPFPVIDRVEPIEHGNLEKKTSPPPESTESIIDKLDRVQSELSSGFLAGGFRTAGNTLQLDVLNDRDRSANHRRFTTTGKTPVISKFVPRRYNDKRYEHTSTTARPRLETTMDNLEGLLPREYVTRTSTASGPTKTGFRWPSSKNATTTTEAHGTKSTSTTPASLRKNKTNAIVQDISAFLPPGYKLRKEETSVTEGSVLSDILSKSKVDISSLLPPDFKRKNDAKPKTENATSSTTAKSVTTSEAPAAKKSIHDLFAKSEFDLSSLLPRDYEQKQSTVPPETKSTVEVSTESTTSANTEATNSTTKKPGGLKIVFPSRPGGRKAILKYTTPQSPRAGEGPGGGTPKIQKGWPTRATTEFTGWPTSSTTPISIEKLLEAARTATVASVNASLIPITNVISSSSTTSTTTTTPRPTTPGICEDECEVAGTIRLIGNATWVPELLDRNTQEWQQLANEVEREMNFIFLKSAVLTNWYKKIRIDSFSQGSILVDYFVELTNLPQTVNTQELKVIFHDSLRTYNSDRWNDTKTKGAMRLGSFTIDPKFTDFIVIPKVTAPPYVEEENRLLPQWAIAVIVIGVGGLLFITIFGVSVLINRQNRAKLKPSMSAIYEEEVAKNLSSHRSDYSKPVHTIWTDPDVSWNDKSFESTSNKVLVEKPFQDNRKYNLYDSWRSEWNGYYCNPSQASSKYGGYDSTTNLSSRHHPDYDTNF